MGEDEGVQTERLEQRPEVYFAAAVEGEVEGAEDGGGAEEGGEGRELAVAGWVCLAVVPVDGEREEGEGSEQGSYSRNEGRGPRENLKGESVVGDVRDGVDGGTVVES